MTDETPIVSASMEVRGYQIVAKKFESFVQGAIKLSAKTIYDLVWKWRRVIATYPPPYSGEPPMVWKRDAEGYSKQRAYVMWAIRKGILQVPYHRTGRYGWNWRVERDRSIATTDGIAYRLYNRGVPYARFVSGGAVIAESQAPIHVGRWIALLDSLEGFQMEVPELIQAQVALAARSEGLNG